MNMKSIYETICENITPEGRLSLGFVLPGKETKPNEIGFAPGAKDGISVFHMDVSKPDCIAQKLVQLIKNGEYEEITTLLHNHGTLNVIDPVLKALQKDHDGIDLRKLIDYACGLMLGSTDAELVKFGIALLGMFDLSDEQEMMDTIKTLGLCDEFTLYALVAIQHWSNGNELIFSIAQKVYGWGKIHAVERLEADTEEIRGWLLRFGCKNYVMDAYLGLVCAEKGNMIEMLRQNAMDDELFEGISVIINALIDSGPMAGISDYRHAEESIRLYLQFAQRHAIALEHLWYVLNVYDWLRDADVASKSDLMALCVSIMDRSNWHDLINDAITNPDDTKLYYACDTACRLDMDINELLLQTILAQPIRYSPYLSHVYRNADYAKQLTSLYEEILPLSEMATGMGDYHFATTLHQEHSCLDWVIQELEQYPNMGESLLKAALQSPVIRERNVACRVLERWSEYLQAPVWHISPDIVSILQKVAAVEVNPDTKKRMEKILVNGH